MIFGSRRRVFSTAITVEKVNALLKQLKINKKPNEFCQEVEQMQITTESLLKVLEANFELGNERQVVFLIGQLLRNGIISLQAFWDELVLPLFEIIDELVLDMSFVVSSFVEFFGKLIKQAKVKFFALY